MSKPITDTHIDDGIDRRGFLQCVAWPGTATFTADHEPGPMKVEDVQPAGRDHSLAVIDSTLAPAS